MKNITEFKTKYCRIQDFKEFHKNRVGYNFEDELQRFWNSIAKPLSKDQALDLPPLTAVPVSLQPGPGYAKVLKERLFDGKFLDNPSALLHGLRQSKQSEPKVKWLDEFLEGVSDNVVITQLQVRAQPYSIC